MKILCSEAEHQRLLHAYYEQGTRYVPYAEQDGWHIGDVFFNLPAKGWGAKTYNSRRQCLAKCQTLNAPESCHS
jgi:hypothetical protein